MVLEDAPYLAAGCKKYLIHDRNRWRQGVSWQKQVNEPDHLPCRIPWRERNCGGADGRSLVIKTPEQEKRTAGHRGGYLYRVGMN